MVFVSLNKKYNVLVDQQLIMLSKPDVLWLRNQIEKHLAHSDLELEAIGRKTVEEHHPNMVDQFNFDYFKE